MSHLTNNWGNRSGHYNMELSYIVGQHKKTPKY